MLARHFATHLLYLHGFRSSPQSAKARQVVARVQARHPGVTCWCPQLPPSPQAAMALLRQGVADWPWQRMVVVGSSLGGFYATWIAEHTGCRAVLLNPAVAPARDLARYIGEHTSWHAPEERFYFDPAYIAELQALTLHNQPPPARYRVLIAQGDEVLDWREMATRYASAQPTVLPGGDHALTDFGEHMDGVFQFLHLLPGPAST
jgi:predicted esterase YcpF (UPF0227 family)